MARGMNHVFLIGALARDPELRYTPSGTAVFEATVAGEDHLIGTDGRERKLPWYHRVSILGKPAEWQAERNLKGGDAVMVEGSLEYSQWEAPEGGKRSMVRVKALRMEQLGYEPELVSDAGGGVRMGSGMNEVVLIGNVVRDPELRAAAVPVSTKMPAPIVAPRPMQTRPNAERSRARPGAGTAVLRALASCAMKSPSRWRPAASFAPEDARAAKTPDPQPVRCSNSPSTCRCSRSSIASARTTAERVRKRST